MSKRLIITEKPSVARDISAALGGFDDESDYFENDEFVVTWAVGHLLELAQPQEYDPKYKSWVVANLPIIPENFQIRPKDGQKGRLALIKKLGKRKDVVGSINACDAGREGELIYRRIAEYTGLDQKPMERLWLQSMTSSAIQTGFDNLKAGDEFVALSDAAKCRSVGDWLIGMNATRALTQRLKSRGEAGAWTAGRVQTPTLNLLVQREWEIMAHVPKPYWEIKGEFQHEQQTWIASFWNEAAKKDGDRTSRPDRIFDEDELKALFAALEKATIGSARETRKPSKQKAPMLFDLTSLQREANRRFSFSAKRTLNAAQRLYEGHKLITYPRTDSKYLPDDYEEHVHKALDVLQGDFEYGAIAKQVVSDGPLNLDVILNSEKVSDHFAIVPTGNEAESVLTGDDAKIFDLVVRQFLAAMMPPAIWNQVERFVAVDVLGKTVQFRATSRTLDVPGFQAALRSTSEDTSTAKQQLPYLIPGEKTVSGVDVSLLTVSNEQKETKPRGRFTEAALLRMMETAGEQIEDEDLSEVMRGKGLGTPATRADTIENLVRKAYVRRASGRLVPSTKAIRLIDVLERVEVPVLASPKLTGEWEYSLMNVQEGALSHQEMLERLTTFTAEMTKALVGFEHDELYQNDPPISDCPACGIGKIGESAWGYPCSRNQGKDAECKFMIWKDRGGRYLDRSIVSLLIEKKETGVLSGFFDRSGREGTAKLRLGYDEEKERWAVQTEYENSGGPDLTEETEVGEFGKCPVHEDCSVIETTARYVCKKMYSGEIKKGGCVLAKTVCHREMGPEEARMFFSEAGRTEILDGFISKRGRPFRGLLFRKDNGRHGFEFPPREPRKPKKTAAKKAPAKKAAAKKTTAKKATTKKTTAKKATTKKTSAKKVTTKKTTTRKRTTTSKSNATE